MQYAEAGMVGARRVVIHKYRNCGRIAAAQAVRLAVREAVATDVPRVACIDESDVAGDR